MMTIRVLKKKSKQAAPLLAHYRASPVFLASRGDAYHGLIIRCPHKPDRQRFKTHGCDCAWHPLKGTPMTGEISGYYEPEWSERTALEDLQTRITWEGRPQTMSDNEWSHALRIAGVHPITEKEVEALFGADAEDEVAA